ncbi:peptidase inhibitor family I36 protein [Streptomyces macrosporus]|uniref:Peptidase inhibitor family I36 n=1 Tax=Streptomyces macrosporus TaxID=44032 RepID=A0ABP5WDU3_9ACTN
MRARLAHFVGVAAVAAGLLTAVPSTAAADATATGAVARYEGRNIDLLRDGWQGAHTCVATTPEDVDCYDTGSEADAALGYDRTADAKGLPACARGWLCIYEHANGGGRRLIFNDEYWHDLNEYGFANQASSWRNRQSRGDSGGLKMGNGQQIWLGAPEYSSNLGGYNDRARWVHG